MQRVGAFKFRGATNAVLRLGEEEAAKGVVTHSSGNMAQVGRSLHVALLHYRSNSVSICRHRRFFGTKALALAAQMRGIPAHIVMPSDAPEVKKQAVLGYGGLVTECVPTLEARETTAQAIIDDTGATFIHPYDNPHVMAGQVVAIVIDGGCVDTRMAGWLAACSLSCV